MKSEIDELKKQLKVAHKKFKQIERRAKFYDVAVKLIKNGFDTEGYILLLSTWNISYFKYKVNKFNIEKFKQVTKQCKKMIMKYRNKTIIKADFHEISDTIEEAFDNLRKINGVANTGASKVLHLMNKKLFIPWDSYISGNQPKKDYKRLNLNVKKYTHTGKSYVQFLIDTQKKFKRIEWKGRISLAKVIDEFNYVNITWRMKKQEKEERKSKI